MRGVFEIENTRQTTGSVQTYWSWTFFRAFGVGARFIFSQLFGVRIFAISAERQNCKSNRKVIVYLSFNPSLFNNFGICRASLVALLDSLLFVSGLVKKSEYENGFNGDSSSDRLELRTADIKAKC